MLLLLKHQPLCVCQLSGILKESQPKISKHLSKLRDLGLVHDERRERFIYYTLNPNYPLLMLNLEWLSQNPTNEVYSSDLDRLKNADLFLNGCSLVEMEPAQTQAVEVLV